MGFEGVKINQLNGGLGGENDNEDNIVAIVAAVDLADLPVGKEHHKPYKILQVKDAESLGVNASYDDQKKVLIYDSIEQVFLYAPEATVYLIFSPVATPAAMLATDSVKAALRGVPEVKGIGIIGTASTVSEVATQAAAIQAVVDEFKAEHRLLDFVIVPGLGETAPEDIMAIADYPNLRELQAPNVSVCIAQDPATASLDAAYAKYADVGAALGMLAVRGVSENLGSVDIQIKPSAKKGDRDYPLTDTASGRWLTANLSDGKKLSDLSSTDKNALTAKGYIFAGSYEGYGGVFFNSSPTAVEKASDYSYIERNRVWNKAARLIRTTLIPEVKGKVKKDPATGYIRSTTITRWTGLVKGVLEQMEAADEISGSDVYINPKQVLSETSPLNIKVKVIMDDIVHEFEIDLGLTKQV